MSAGRKTKTPPMFVCAGCQLTGVAPIGSEGQPVMCPRCGTMNVVPAPAPPRPATANIRRLPRQAATTRVPPILAASPATPASEPGPTALNTVSQPTASRYRRRPAGHGGLWFALATLVGVAAVFGVALVVIRVVPSDEEGSFADVKRVVPSDEEGSFADVRQPRITMESLLGDWKDTKNRVSMSFQDDGLAFVILWAGVGGGGAGSIAGRAFESCGFVEVQLQETKFTFEGAVSSGSGSLVEDGKRINLILEGQPLTLKRGS